MRQRREVLHGMGVAVLSALAGCFSGNGGPETNTGTDGTTPTGTDQQQPTTEQQTDALTATTVGTTQTSTTTAASCVSPTVDPVEGKSITVTASVEQKSGVDADIDADMKLNFEEGLVRMDDSSSKAYQQVSEGDCVTVSGKWARESGTYYIADATIEGETTPS